VLTADRAIAEYFETVVAAGADPKAAANWVMTESLTGYNEAGRFAVPATALASLLGLIKAGTVSHQAAKKIFLELAADGADPRAVAERLGLLQVRDEGTLETWVDEVLAAHPQEVLRYRAGEAKLLGFLTGQVMRRSQGKADPKGVQPVLVRKLEAK
jgi:aspartyl-tRNA(Asn)/glutamyl-tRNA(Gln) amidotransferase subunit B